MLKFVERLGLRALGAIAALAIFSVAGPASAQLAFVSATGNDANTCWVEADPCQTLQRGINQTATGGELRVLSQIISSGFINRSMTIDAGGHTIIGSFTIDSTAAIVAFRRIVLTGRGVYPKGFNIVNAGAVHIEDCTVERYTGNGIHLQAGTATKLFVSDTVSRDNAANGLSVFAQNNARVTVQDSRFENNGGSGIFLREIARANVTRSVASANGADGVTVSGGTASLTETTAANNNFVGVYVRPGNAPSKAILASSVARGNGGAGLQVEVGASAVITDSAFTSNGYGVINSGTLLTRQNNTNTGNEVADYQGGGPQPSPAL